MRGFCAILTLLIATHLSAAQNETKPKKVVVWGGDPGCGYKNFGLESNERLICTLLQTPRGAISVVEHDGLAMGVGFFEYDGLIIAAVQIKNSTTSAVDFDTDDWGAAHFDSPETYYRGLRPILAETSIPSREIIRGIRSGTSIDNSADAYLAGITKTSEVKEIRKPDGTRVPVVVITQDKAAQEIATSRGEARKSMADSEQQRIRKTAMTAKWVAPQGEAKGLVYFRRVDKARFVLFVIKIENVTYLFRFLRSG